MYCNECGKEISNRSKFCSHCGFQIPQENDDKVNKNLVETNNREQKMQLDPNIIQNQSPTENLLKNAPLSKKEQGYKLENLVQLILENNGYKTEKNKYVKGEKGTSEIDIYAVKGRETMFVECKNHKNNINKKDVRDFISKMEDNDIKAGLFVAGYSYFSKGSKEWGDKHENIKIEFWDKDDFEVKYRQTNTMKALLGRNEETQTTKINDCLDLKDSIENYCKVQLKNNTLVNVKNLHLKFNPYYVVSFALQETVKTPDKRSHSISTAGKCIVDAINGDILFNQKSMKDIFGKDQVKAQITKDLDNISAKKTVVVKNKVGMKPEILKPVVSKQDMNSILKGKIAHNNRRKIQYSLKKPKRERNDDIFGIPTDCISIKSFNYIPSHSKIKLFPKLIYVPELIIIFNSKEHEYVRKLLPASSTVILDEIATCKHKLRNKPAFAICNECGVVKCKDDIFINESSYYCKDCAPDEIKEDKKGFRSKFSFRK